MELGLVYGRTLQLLLSPLAPEGAPATSLADDNGDGSGVHWRLISGMEISWTLGSGGTPVDEATTLELVEELPRWRAPSAPPQSLSIGAMTTQ